MLNNRYKMFLFSINQMRPTWEGDRIRVDLTGGSWGVRTYLGSMQLSGIGEVVDCAEMYVCRDEQPTRYVVNP
jgi:hypothetical protein